MAKNFRIFIYSTLIFFNVSNILSNNLSINGLSKLNLNDLQTQTSIDLNKDNFTNDDIDILLKDFYQSDLIFDLKYNKDNDDHYITIQENKLIENIFFNGNLRIDDDLLLQNISAKKNGFINKNNISNDIKLIKSIYKVKGFNNVNVIVSTEKYSNDRINLIYEITENNQSQISRIKFIGNTSYSDRYLLSLINTKSRNFYNIFTSGSNLNIENFKFDVGKVKSFYKQKGYFDVNVDFNISEISSNKYTVNFYVNEGGRIKLDTIDIDTSNLIFSNKIETNFKNFLKKMSKNNLYYDQIVIDKFVDKINKILIKNNNFNTIFVSNLERNSKTNKLLFTQKKVSLSTINKINIVGNNITKDKILRSKLPFEPGDYFNSNLLNVTKNELMRNKYINDVNITSDTKEGKSNITIDIEENKKTGRFLAGGTFSGDNGAGLTLSANDDNIFGSGNSLDTNFTANDEDILFRLSLIQYPVALSKIRNSYTIFNNETDLINSFGFKSDELGVLYSINFDYDELINITSGLSYKISDRHSAKKSISSINDNIGEYNIYTLSASLKQDSTNDFLYPTDGVSNSIHFEYSPKDLSDDSYYKFVIKSDIYRKFKNSNKFLFLSNDFGFAESLEGNLSTINSFSLGGMNFKGFDYRGVGPKQDDIYIGGNKFFTSTIGYGGSFLFDDKDNVNTKLFYSLGSIWDSDYSENNEFDIRSSLGVSLDVLTAIGPISFSYAIPIEKNNDDTTNEFNFSIGTSF